VGPRLPERAGSNASLEALNNYFAYRRTEAVIPADNLLRGALITFSFAQNGLVADLRSRS
jgi:hypothetical protein